MDFKVCEVIDERNSAHQLWDGELDNVAIEELWSSCLVLHHFPGVSVSTFGREMVCQCAAKHSQLHGEVYSKSVLTTDLVLCNHLWCRRQSMKYTSSDRSANKRKPFTSVISSFSVREQGLLIVAAKLAQKLL